jgi:hypothetical protein
MNIPLKSEFVFLRRRVPGRVMRNNRDNQISRVEYPYIELLDVLRIHRFNGRVVHRRAPYKPNWLNQTIANFKDWGPSERLHVLSNSSFKDAPRRY